MMSEERRNKDQNFGGKRGLLTDDAQDAKHARKDLPCSVDHGNWIDTFCI